MINLVDTQYIEGIRFNGFKGMLKYSLRFLGLNSQSCPAIPMSRKNDVRLYIIHKA